jgi:hypothetical protein
MTMWVWETRKFPWHQVGDFGRRFHGVRPGWVAMILVDGYPKQLEGVFGFAVDAAICRNYWIAYNDDEYTNRYNEIPEGENWHD